MPAVPPKSDSAPPDHTRRSVVTLLLVIHLFLVIVALSSNFFPSPLQAKLLDRFAFYTRVLHVDRSFLRADFQVDARPFIPEPAFLTHATEQDVDHRVEVLTSTTEDDWLLLSTRGFPGSERYRRYQRFAKLMSALAADEAAAGLLAQSVGTHFVQQRASKPQQVRVRKHLLQPMVALRDGTEEERDPASAVFFRTDYAANILVLRSGVSVVKIDAASQVAAPVGAGAAVDEQR